MGFNILYLDDEEQLCEILCEFLSSEDIKVYTFTTAAEAISFCRETPPDLVFLDYRLKETTGLEVAKQLDSAICKILVTGELVPPVSSDFDHVISKPYKLSDIKELVNHYYP